MSFFYFLSYGSNLLFERIHRRVDSVEVIQTHKLPGYKLEFNKKSVDGSMKANVTRDKDSYVWGVIHRIDHSQKSVLDKYEALGLGYELKYFKEEIYGNITSVGFYQATDPEYLGTGKPYEWYFEYVKRGAVQNGFPNDYIQKIENIGFIKDQDEKRRNVNWKVLESLM
jgi:hypothetical protein